MQDRDAGHSGLLGFFAEVSAFDQMVRALVEARLPKGFQWSQFAVLNHLFLAGEGQTPVALARTFEVPKTSMTHTLIVLEKHGLVRIEPNPKDGRSKLVWLTPKGRTLRSVAMTALGPDLDALAARVDVQGLAPLRAAMFGLRQVMETLRDA
ncbi:MarR family winged helix-turn-helix transcriptional regulator [Paragemmobacter straminiformis]|uniref:MarR family transcriptional regulator n=1 Tax=Paragemmobacter straminiformis TaxID=2045119 RepID=A0A842IA03_9RHOB|nr:MarR family transcriptional regulator [Gemmobacter straminiformis]MBC2836421.1 MarR family transcriptional regulator [Gemmobacter straminiformis]